MSCNNLGVLGPPFPHVALWLSSPVGYTKHVSDSFPSKLTNHHCITMTPSLYFRFWHDKSGRMTDHLLRTDSTIRSQELGIQLL